MVEDEYRELFVAEALDIVEGLNAAFTELERNPENMSKIDEIFRMTHTLKGNAMGMGFTSIGEVAHVVEDIFGEIKKNKSLLSSELFQAIFKSIDKLGELVDALSTGEEVSYKGLRTKLEVHLQKIRSGSPGEPAEETKTTPVETTRNDQPGASESSGNSGEEPQSQPVQPEDAPAKHVVELLGDLALNDVPEDTPLTASEAQLVAGPVYESTPVAASAALEAMAQVKTTEVLEEETDEEDDSLKSKINFSETIQVPTRKADDLLTLIGELLIERDAVVSKLTHQNGITNGFDRLNRIVSDLQYGIMNIRLVKVGFLFNKFTRIVRDVANIEAKQVDLVLEGTEIEIDRNILKTISDAMIHLVRNAVSHGIEKPEKRAQKGKPKKGKVTLKARNENDNVVIEVTDDGNGIDHEQILKKAISKGIVDEETARTLTKNEILLFIFEPGFSNAEVVNEVSGRGVGMDVVKRSTESIGGRVQVDTTLGKGTTISLHLPSSLAVKGALLFELDSQEFAITINYTEAVISLRPNEINHLPNGCVAKYLGEPIPILFLTQFFDNPRHISAQGLGKGELSEKLDVIVVRYQYRLIGLVVDKLLLQQEIVEKNLKGMLSNHEFFKTATILGNGNVCLILDIPSVFKLIQEKTKHIKRAA